MCVITYQTATDQVRSSLEVKYLAVLDFQVNGFRVSESWAKDSGVQGGEGSQLQKLILAFED